MPILFNGETRGVGQVQRVGVNFARGGDGRRCCGPRVTGVGMGCCAATPPVVSSRPRARQTARRGNQVTRGVQVF